MQAYNHSIQSVHTCSLIRLEQYLEKSVEQCDDVGMAHATEYAHLPKNPFRILVRLQDIWHLLQCNVGFQLSVPGKAHFPIGPAPEFAHKLIPVKERSLG